MFETKRQALLSRQAFAARVARSALIGGGLFIGSLAAGIVGYHVLVGLPWIDALLNASMILTGMGPVAQVTTVAGKLFASFYALFSGVIFLGATGVVVAPIAHRLLHRFHAETEEEEQDDEKQEKTTGGRAAKGKRGGRDPS